MAKFMNIMKQLKRYADAYVQCERWLKSFWDHVDSKGLSDRLFAASCFTNAEFWLVQTELEGSRLNELIN